MKFTRVLGSLVALGISSLLITAVNCGGVKTTADGEAGVDVTIISAKIVLPDGTEKELSDTPLPLNLRVRLTFSEAVDTASVEGLFSLMDGDKDVPHGISWNEDNTMMTIKPFGRLDYQTTYTLAIEASSESDGVAALSKADVQEFSKTFSTMLRNDINGDGKADVLAGAGGWNSGNGTGRAYIFYGDRIRNMGAESADAKINGKAEGDSFRGVGVLDINDDGYGDLYCFAGLNPGTLTRAYFFYGGSGETPISGEIAAMDAAFILSADAIDNSFLVRVVADVNGDGRSDLIASVPECSNGAGCVYVFFGPDFQSELASEADVVIRGNQAEGFGSPLTAADVNGDGIEDIISTALDAINGTGKIYVFFGGSDLTGGSSADADVIIGGENEGDTFGFRQLGDLDADGITDIVAASRSINQETGKVYVFYGSALSNKGAVDADVKIVGDALGDRFGANYIIGDVNGDKVDDLLVEASEYNEGGGRVYGFFGGSLTGDKSAADADFLLNSETEGDNLTPAAIGDVNGDGINDIVLSAYNYPDRTLKGRIYAIFGGGELPTGSAAGADIVIDGEREGELFRATRIVYDVNGDGTMDIIAGAPRYFEQDRTGLGYVFYGGSGLSSGSAGTADVIIQGENPGDSFGF